MSDARLFTEPTTQLEELGWKFRRKHNTLRWRDPFTADELLEHEAIDRERRRGRWKEKA